MMRIVVDTNVLMAGILKDHIVREVLLSKNIQFFIPEYGISEIKKYKQELAQKSGLDEQEIETIISIILENIEIVPQELIKPRMKEAQEIMKEIDSKDSPFIAAALAMQANGIWSFDHDFLKQKIIKVITIQEIVEIR